jgi:GNAT superfamily N-acetyltransferase
VTPRSVEIIPFSRQISRDDCFCGNEILDSWLKQFAGQNESRFRSRTFFAIDQDSNQLLGFYTSVFTALDEGVQLVGMPVSQYKKPAFLIARLAVNRLSQNEGVGTMLLIDALIRAMQASEAAGLEVVLVDAIDSNAISFYARFGFTRHDLASNRMYISMIDLQNG